MTAHISLNAVRFTPLSKDGRPDLAAAFTLDADTEGTGMRLMAEVDMCTEEERVDVSTWARPRQWVMTYDVVLSVCFPDYGMKFDAEALLKRLREGTAGMKGAAVEGWMDTRADGVWGYLGFPWLRNIRHLTDEEGRLRGMYEVPETEEGFMMIQDFCTAHTRLGAAPWPPDAPPVLRREGGASEAMPSGLETHYVMATTPIPPPRPVAA